MIGPVQSRYREAVQHDVLQEIGGRKLGGFSIASKLHYRGDWHVMRKPGDNMEIITCTQTEEHMPKDITPRTGPYLRG